MPSPTYSSGFPALPHCNSLVLLLGFARYGVQYLLLVEKIASLSYWQVFVLTVLAGSETAFVGLTQSVTLSPSRISRWSARSRGIPTRSSGPTENSGRCEVVELDLGNGEELLQAGGIGGVD
nr:protein NUCLEAR FUSION DEFECTIVE 4-like [Ipomoea batatas]